MLIIYFFSYVTLPKLTSIVQVENYLGKIPFYSLEVTTSMLDFQSQVLGSIPDSHGLRSQDLASLSLSTGCPSIQTNIKLIHVVFIQYCYR